MRIQEFHFFPQPLANVKFIIHIERTRDAAKRQKAAISIYIQMRISFVV